MSEDEFDRWLRDAHQAMTEDLARQMDVRGGLRAFKARAARRPRIRRWRRRWH